MGSIIKLAGRGLSRAFTKDGGTLGTLTDRIDRKDSVYYLAFAFRSIAGVLATGLAYYISTKLGVPVDEFIETMKSLG